MIAPASKYGCGADDCISCYGDEEWQDAQQERTNDDDDDDSTEEDDD